MEEWTDNYNKVKAAHNGNYPDYWYKEIIMSRLIGRVCPNGGKMLIIEGIE